MTIHQHWDAKFKTRDWGKYPPEDLVRFMARRFGSLESRKGVSVLEVGCGPGANLRYMLAEGYKIHGIDSSPTAIEIARRNLKILSGNKFSFDPDIVCGDFSSLPWSNGSFDVVVDIFSIYANYIAVIQKTAIEINRVLKESGILYAKLWGTKTVGYGDGELKEPNTYDNIQKGPLYDMGVAHFFDEKDIPIIFAPLKLINIDRLTRTDRLKFSGLIEEFHCTFVKN